VVKYGCSISKKMSKLVPIALMSVGFCAALGLPALAGKRADYSPKRAESSKSENIPSSQLLAQAASTTQLIYSTPANGTYISGQQTLAVIDVSNYSQIRVIANTDGNVKVTLTEEEFGTYFVKMDSVNITPDQVLSKVYDVPGRKLVVIANASQGNPRIFIAIYGRSQ